MSKPIAIGRRVGFDFGQKRIGVATSDSESILVSPHATLLNDDKLINKLKDIITEVSPFYIVVGNPKHLSGDNSEISEAAYAFATLLKAYLLVRSTLLMNAFQHQVLTHKCVRLENQSGIVKRLLIRSLLLIF